MRSRCGSLLLAPACSTLQSVLRWLFALPVLVAAMILAGTNQARSPGSDAASGVSRLPPTSLEVVSARSDSELSAFVDKALATGCRCPGITDSSDVTGDPLINPAHHLHEITRDSLRAAMDCWKDPAHFHDWCCGDRRPELVNIVEPSYPESLWRAGVNDTVVVLCFVNREGKVARVRCERGRVSLYEAVIDAVCQWRFEPAEWACESGLRLPFGVWVTVPVILRSGTRKNDAQSTPP